MVVVYFEICFDCFFNIILVLICVILAPNQYFGGYANPDASYPPPVQGGGTYADGYGRPFVHMGVGPAGEGLIPYNTSNSVVSSTTARFGGAAMSTTGGGAQWAGPFDPSLSRG